MFSLDKQGIKPQNYIGLKWKCPILYFIIYDYIQVKNWNTIVGDVVINILKIIKIVFIINGHLRLKNIYYSQAKNTYFFKLLLSKHNFFEKPHFHIYHLIKDKYYND